jgi:hypothetical protein
MLRTYLKNLVQKGLDNYWNKQEQDEMFIVHLFQIQADWEIDSQTTGYRMCHISEQMCQLIIGTSLGNIMWNIHNTDIEHKWILQKI